MPKFQDVVQLTQDAVAQIMGTNYMSSLGDFAGLDSYKLADVGNAVFDSTNGKDRLVNALIDSIGAIEAEVRPYEGDLSSIMVKPQEWGGFVERAYFAPSDIIQDPMYNLVNGTSYDDHIFYQPQVTTKFYQERKSILTPISIGTEQLKSAFNSWEQLDKFVSGIRAAVRNTIEIGINSYKHMIAQCAIAMSTYASGMNTAVHLLTEAKAASIVPATETASTAIYNPEFLTFALMRIAETRDNMRIMSTAFNNGSVPVNAYSEDDTKLVLLSGFEKACKFRLKARTFNKDELSVGEYDRTPAWQGHDSGTGKFEFATNSSVSINADTDAKLGIGTSAFAQSYVIGLMFDRKALGICPYERKVTSSYTAIADFWNDYHHLLMNAMIDSNYNIVAFIID